MTDQRDDGNLGRREVLRGMGAAAVAGLAASAPSALAEEPRRMSPAARNSGPLGARLQGVQHFGLTVQNMDRAFAFYTEVLGFVEKLYRPEAWLAIVVSPEDPEGTAILLEPNNHPVSKAFQQGVRGFVRRRLGGRHFVGPRRFSDVGIADHGRQNVSRLAGEKRAVNTL